MELFAAEAMTPAAKPSSLPPTEAQRRAKPPGFRPGDRINDKHPDDDF